MPERELQQQLKQLREYLAQNSLSDSDQQALLNLAADIENKLTSATNPAETSVIDDTSTTSILERLEAEHPSLTMTVRNIMQTLANMGI